MSYCRWSSDDHQCDVYVWADCAGGWRTEVAGRRPVFEQPMPPPVTLPVGAPHSREREAWINAWSDRDSATRDLMGPSMDWTYVELPEPEGGRSFWHDTPGECADNLAALVAAGFNVPPSAIEALREEQAEMGGTTPREEGS